MEHRKAYAQDRKGKIYEMELSIGKGRKRNILYDINNIKEINHGVVVSEATSSTKETKVANGLAHKNQSLESIITDNPENASTKFSLKEPVEETGMQIIEYATGDEQARLETLNELEDVRFSLPEEYDRVRRENETLLRENETFKQIIDQLERTLDIKKKVNIDGKNIEVAAKKILRQYQSKMDAGEFTERVAALFNSMSNGEMIAKDFEYLAETVVRPMIEQSRKCLSLRQL